MKRLAAIVLTALLLTGCTAQPSERWTEDKHKCIASGVKYWGDHSVLPDEVDTHAELEQLCNRTADKKSGIK